MDDELRTYLINGGALPARLASKFGDDDESVASLSNWSFTQRWAWEELQRRLRVCLDQGRPPTGLLAVLGGYRRRWRSETAEAKRERR